MGANWEPKGRQMGAKLSSRGDSSANGQNLKNCRTSYAKSLFLKSRGLFLGTKSSQNVVLELLEAPLSHLGALGGFPRALGGILRRSWRLLEGSWSEKRRARECEEARGELKESSRRIKQWPGEG